MTMVELDPEEKQKRIDRIMQNTKEERFEVSFVYRELIQFSDKRTNGIKQSMGLLNCFYIRNMK